jgi:hypothetical protein
LIEKAEFEVKTSVSAIKATMSFGIAGREHAGMTANEIVHNADAALYQAKLGGRNRVYLYANQVFESVTIPGEKVESGELLTPSRESLEVRTQPIKYPYQPSTLREGPQPVPSPAQPAPQFVSPSAQSSRVSFPAWRLDAFITIVAVVALLLFVVTFRLREPVDWVGIGIFAALVLVTEGMSIDIFVKGTTVSTSAAPILAGTLLFGPVASVVLSFTFAAVSLVKNRSKLSRFIFNMGNQMVAGLL